MAANDSKRQKRVKGKKLRSIAGGLDAQLAELARIDRRRRFGEHADRFLAFGKRDHVAQRRRAAEEHRQAIDAEGDAAVRRRAEAERFEEEAELRLGLFPADAQQRENSLLQLEVMDTDAA